MSCNENASVLITVQLQLGVRKLVNCKAKRVKIEIPKYMRSELLLSQMALWACDRSQFLNCLPLQWTRLLSDHQVKACAYGLVKE